MHGAVSTKPATVVRVRQVSQMETKQVTKPETSKHLCVEPNKKPEIHEINNFFKTASVIIWSLIGAQDWGSSPSECLLHLCLSKASFLMMMGFYCT